MSRIDRPAREESTLTKSHLVTSARPACSGITRQTGSRQTRINTTEMPCLLILSKVAWPSRIGSDNCAMNRTMPKLHSPQCDCES